MAQPDAPAPPDQPKAHTPTPAEVSRTSVMGPTNIAPDLPGVSGTEEIHGNRTGLDFREGATPPEHLKWYVGQGGVTGHQSATPFATHDPSDTRPPDDAPAVDWDPTSTTDLDIVSDTAAEADGAARRSTPDADVD